MYEYEFQQYRSAELIRRAARRQARHGGAVAESHTPRRRGHRFARTA